MAVVMIAIVTKSNKQYFAFPCTRELSKNCEVLFPSDHPIYFIPQIYTGMMQTSRESTLNRTAGKAILGFFYGPIMRSKNDVLSIHMTLPSSK